MRTPRHRNEAGIASVWALLLIGGTLTLLLGLVVDGGDALNDRREAARVAEQAARAGADELDRSDAWAGGNSINPAAAQEAAGRWVSGTGWNASVSVSGTTVSVTVTGSTPANFLGAIGVDSFRIDETATAEAITDEDGDES